MFYPIQSTVYTWNTSKKIYEVFTSFSLYSKIAILSCIITFIILISFHMSIGMGTLCIFLFWIGLIDIYDRIIPDILLLCVACNLWIMNAPVYFSSLSIAFSIICIKLIMESWYKKMVIGWGDIKLLTLCVLFTPLYSTPTLLFISGTAGLIIAFALHSKAFPFAPAIIAGFLSTFILY